MQSKVKQVALTGCLFALAVVFSYAEAMVSPLLGLPPGVKIGLANLVLMYALLFLPARYAALLLALKVSFAFFTRGAVAAALGAAGGLLALLLMLALLRPRPKAGLLLVSVLGALAHNLGQLLAAYFLFNNTYLLYYAPVLGLAAIVAGGLNAALLRSLLPVLGKAGFAGAGSTKPGQ